MGICSSHGIFETNGQTDHLGKRMKKMFASLASSEGAASTWMRDCYRYLLVRFGSSSGLDCGTEHLLQDLWCDIVVQMMISKTEVMIKTIRRPGSSVENPRIESLKD